MQRLRITGYQACPFLFPSYPGWPGHLLFHLRTEYLPILERDSPFLTSLNHCLHTGEDPLVDDQNERDINSVAGVLKLYFRGLENPLFPKERFQDLISTISKYFPGGWPIALQVFIEVEGLALYLARHGKGTP